MVQQDARHQVQSLQTVKGSVSAAERAEQVVEWNGKTSARSFHVFINETSEPVELFWFYDSVEQRHGTIEPGSNLYVGTYTFNQWKVRGKGGQLLGVHAGQSATVTVRPKGCVISFNASTVDSDDRDATSMSTPKGVYAIRTHTLGFPVWAFECVEERAVQRAAHILARMLEGCPPSLLQAMLAHKPALAVLGRSHVVTDAPPHSFMRHNTDRQLDATARGLGATTAVPVTSCAEENLTMEGDTLYPCQSILVHELGHAVQNLGFDAALNNQIEAAYKAALAERLYPDGCYMVCNTYEYWATGTEAWFESTLRTDVNGDVNTRDKVRRHDPRLASILAAVYGDTPWRYQHDSPHPLSFHSTPYVPRHTAADAAATATAAAAAPAGQSPRAAKQAALQAALQEALQLVGQQQQQAPASTPAAAATAAAVAVAAATTSQAAHGSPAAAAAAAAGAPADVARTKAAVVEAALVSQLKQRVLSSSSTGPAAGAAHQAQAGVGHSSDAAQVCRTAARPSSDSTRLSSATGPAVTLQIHGAAHAVGTITDSSTSNGISNGWASVQHGAAAAPAAGGAGSVRAAMLLQQLSQLEAGQGLQQQAECGPGSSGSPSYAQGHGSQPGSPRWGLLKCQYARNAVTTTLCPGNPMQPCDAGDMGPSEEGNNMLISPRASHGTSQRHDRSQPGHAAAPHQQGPPHGTPTSLQTSAGPVSLSADARSASQEQGGMGGQHEGNAAQGHSGSWVLPFAACMPGRHDQAG